MRSSSAYSALPDRAVVVAELRRLLPKIEGVRTEKPIPFGLAAIDRCLPQGGLSSAALHEIVPAEGSTPAAFGFLAALLVRAAPFPPPARGRSTTEGRRVGVTHFATLTPPRLASSMLADPPLSGEGKVPRQLSPLILVLPNYGLPDYGRPHGHGLNALGLDPRRLLLVETAHRKDTLWAMEEALRSGAPAAVAGVIDQFDLKTSQRLQLAAMDAGLPLFVLRPAQLLETSAAATRWRVAAAPAARDRFGLFARSRWQLKLERCRNGRTGEWMVEYDHVAHCFSLAAALADPAFPRDTGETAIRQACRS